MLVFAMTSVLLLSILGVSSGLQHCPMSKEIVPCTCHYRLDSTKVMSITCDKMKSFEQVVDVLRGHFSPADRVSLRLASSNLVDMQFRKFAELNATIENLRLHHDYIGKLNPDTFEGLAKVDFLSLADNNLEVVPEHLWKKMPNIRTLDMGRSKIRELSESNFEDLRHLECLILPGNQISRMDTNSIPSQIERLHLGRNYIKDLNNTLKNLSNLGWLFVNSNDLDDLEGQLPRSAPDLRLIHASHNKIEKLPQQLKNYAALESMFFQNNRLKSLDGALSKCKNLMRAVLEHNQIDKITEEDFAESLMLESLLLGHNKLASLNNSLSNLKNLNFLNLTYNFLTEFSLQEVVGLQELRSMDLSHNQISTIIGPVANLVEWNFKLTELKLDHNKLETLNGALSGLTELIRLNLSFNKLKKISPDDLIGLDQLQYLDISYNQLKTLEETSKTFLPKLSELKASHNYLSILERDFYGLPVLCHADLSYNEIIALGRDLVARTKCRIEHGVHEGTWDTLKINLQGNPILCDAALPDIVSLMEINHTRIYGVSHCPPLSEQPTTSKPNAFLGYIPETTPSLPAIISTNLGNADQSIENSSTTSTNIEPDLSKVQYEIELNTQQASTPHNQPIALTLQKPTVDVVKLEVQENITKTVENIPEQKIFVQQGQRINELASEIEELRTRLDQLSTQNQILLNQQLSKNITELRKP